MKRNLCLTLIYLVACLLQIAWPPAAANAQQDYQNWLKKQQEAFQEYRDKRDKAFADFLEQEWKKMNSVTGVKRDDKPKPKIIPRAEKVKPRDIIPHKIKIITDFPVLKPVPEVKPDLEDRPAPADLSKVKTVEVNFYNSTLQIDYDKTLQTSLGRKVDNKAISSSWKKMSRTNYPNLIAQTKYYREQLQLNDWGYSLLLNNIAEAIFPASHNERVLLTWFLMSKSGYDARVGYQDNRVYIMLPAQNAMYAVRYFTFENRRYYLVSFDGSQVEAKSIFTYDGSYPESDKVLDLAITRTPNIHHDIAERSLNFNYRDKKHNLKVRYNKNVVNFFKTYPQTDLQIYFAAPISATASQSLFDALKPLVVGRSEVESANILLRFVQKALEYQTDQEQFGKEKYLFPDETLFYPYADCEDRSIFFGYLVKNILGLDVIGLNYPGHVATAVHFSTQVSGEQVVHNGKTYTICDPTFLGADVGMEMTTMQDYSPSVVAKF